VSASPLAHSFSRELVKLALVFPSSLLAYTSPLLLLPSSSSSFVVFSGKFGSSGCRQRFHMPVESDPDYSAAVLEKTIYFNEKISEADAKLAVR
jgi:hypothetical protein